jgi:hypothetical protein
LEKPLHHFYNGTISRSRYKRITRLAERKVTLIVVN